MNVDKMSVKIIYTIGIIIASFNLFTHGIVAVSC